MCKKISLLLLGLLLPRLLWGYTIEAQSSAVEATVRVQAKATAAQQVINKMRYPPFKWVIPEGSLVKRDDLVVEFRDDFVKSEIEDRQFDIDKEKLELQQSQLKHQRYLQDFKNGIEDLEARLAVRRAKRARLISLPRSEDVEIAEGNLDMAQQEYRAAETQYAKDEQRHGKGYISVMALQKSSRARDIALARFEVARADLAQTRLSVSAEDLQIVDLEIANIELEMQYKQRDLVQQEKLTDIKKRAAAQRMHRRQKKFDAKKEELEYAQLRAPADGIVVYNSQLKKKLVDGGKMAKAMNVLEIADLKSMVFKGYISNTLAVFFSKGDRVEVRFNAKGDEKFSAKLVNIGATPVDLAEVNEEWGRNDSTGIKVLAVEVKLDEPNPLFKPGVFANATLHAVEKWVGPAVPLHFVRYYKGYSWLSFEGVFEKVNGVALGKWFFLRDGGEAARASYLGREVGVDGEFPVEEKALKPTVDRNLLSGELVPVDAFEVTVPRQKNYYNYSVVSAVDDGAVVEKGDVLVVLSEKNIDRHIEERQERLSRAEEEVEAQEKSLALKKRERDFKVAVAKNSRDINAHKLTLAKRGNRAVGIRRAELNLRIATIELASLYVQVQRAEQNSKRLSPQELRTLQRAFKRQQLQLESRAVDLDELREVDAASIAAAEYHSLRATMEYTNQKTEYDDEVKKQQLFLEWRRRDLHNAKKELASHIAQREELKVYAPVKGVFRRAKVWDGLQISRLKAGHGVWRKLALGRVVDSSKMHVRFLVPERYYQSVSVGLELPVKIPSLNEKYFKGRIINIEPFFQERPSLSSQGGGFYGTKGSLGEAVFPINIEIEQSDELQPGAIAEISTEVIEK